MDILEQEELHMEHHILAKKQLEVDIQELIMDIQELEQATVEQDIMEDLKV